VDWVWITEAVVLAIHDEQIAEHGGASGCRDLGLLQSALSRPLNLATYDAPDAAALAAAYCSGIVRNHPFVDGNKRTGFVLAELFLDLNGFELTASDADVVLTVLRLADGSLDEAGFAAWIRAAIRAAD
jgi:death-on-curing protein